ncbi:glycosyltransferase family 4 protein [Paracraurococcus ruber]|uniref:Glycosyl transferase n=1 Tax=Paracraurococcus ruber TaxID=77675 RepID=A0ABS1D0W8_9PROT|nr:glycosyltransferase family 4 protein [Paracraurococcus ruber]MBK1660168.1 glycosyl transferase [Paracraurococcus ruber]TDG22206.1 glycosyltransferase family 4 protein [Paracraurococcus ruber]
MRIAQIAPLAEAVPPKLYGGTERVVSWLTEELVALGHEVTLFASGDSVTSATLAPMSPQALRLDKTVGDPNAPVFLMLEKVLRRAQDFDILHFHLDYMPFSLFTRQPVPHVTTLHGRLDLKEIWGHYELHRDVPLISISDSQRQPMAWANWARTIHHGLPETLLRPAPGARPDYLAFLGRISPEKRVDRAIEIAGRAGMKLKIAAKVDRADRDYFEAKIEPLLKLPHVDYIGEIGDHQKAEFLSNAKALLFPIDWPEPFGLVMIEAMACGTPVIAYDHGSVPEVMEDGLTGFIVRDEASAAQAVARLDRLDRAAIRRRFEQRFTARRMAEDHVALYEALVRAKLPPVRAIAAE